jgi:hypothetical protein
MNQDAREIIERAKLAIGETGKLEGLHLISALTARLEALEPSRHGFEASLAVLVRHNLVLEWANEFGKLMRVHNNP